MSFSKLFEIEYHLQASLNHLTFWTGCGIKKGKSKGGKTMKEKVLGCDVSKDYIILHTSGEKLPPYVRLPEKAIAYSVAIKVSK